MAPGTKGEDDARSSFVPRPVRSLGMLAADPGGPLRGSVHPGWTTGPGLPPPLSTPADQPGYDVRVEGDVLNLGRGERQLLGGGPCELERRRRRCDQAAGQSLSVEPMGEPAGRSSTSAVPLRRGRASVALGEALRAVADSRASRPRGPRAERAGARPRRRLRAGCRGAVGRRGGAARGRARERRVALCNIAAARPWEAVRAAR